MTKIKSIHFDSEDQTPLADAYSLFITDPVRVTSDSDCVKKLKMMLSLTDSSSGSDFLVIIIADSVDYDRKDWQNLIIKRTDMAEFTVYNPLPLHKDKDSIPKSDIEKWYNSKLAQSTDIFIFLDCDGNAPTTQSVSETTMQKLKKEDFANKRLILGVEQSFWKKGVIIDVLENESTSPTVLQFSR